MRGSTKKTYSWATRHMEMCGVSARGFAAPSSPDQLQPPKGLREERALCSCNKGPSKTRAGRSLMQLSARLWSPSGHICSIRRE